MTLDVPTITVALFLGHAMLALVLWLARHLAEQEPGLADWGVGVALTLLGLTAIVLRPYIPLSVSIVVGNAGLLLSPVFYARATYRFLGHAREPRWLWAVFAVGLVATVALLGQAVAVRVVVNGLVAVVLLAPTVWVIARQRRQGVAAIHVVGVAFGVVAALQLLRSIDATFNPSSYATVLQSSPLNAMVYLAGFLTVMGAGFGYVFACFERAERRMREQATHDALTGCVNRVGGDALLSNTLARGQRESTPVAYVMLDLDRFKRINDVHGHRTGDEVLRRFAQTVRARLRATDTFSRVGGEEFALLLPATDEAGALRLAEAVRAAVAAMPVASASGEVLSVTVSAGVAVARPEDGWSADQAYQAADDALYAAKHAGRNRVELATDRPSQDVGANG